MAEEISVDNTALSRMERGKQNAPAEYLEAYAGVLGYQLVLIPKTPSANASVVDISRLDFADRLLLARLARVLDGIPRTSKRILSAQVDIYEAEQDIAVSGLAD